MNSNENKPGGGSGGDPPEVYDHGDIETVDGAFERSATNAIILMSQPGDEDTTSVVSLLGSGEEGRINTQAANVVNVTSGRYGGPRPLNLDFPGISLYAVERAKMMIQISLGHFDSLESQRIWLDQDGIHVNAGVSGSLTLSAGPWQTSYIEITPSKITIKSPLVDINPL